MIAMTIYLEEFFTLRFDPYFASQVLAELFVEIKVFGLCCYRLSLIRHPPFLPRLRHALNFFRLCHLALHFSRPHLAPLKFHLSLNLSHQYDFTLHPQNCQEDRHFLLHLVPPNWNLSHYHHLSCHQQLEVCQFRGYCNTFYSSTTCPSKLTDLAHRQISAIHLPPFTVQKLPSLKTVYPQFHRIFSSFDGR